VGEPISIAIHALTAPPVGLAEEVETEPATPAKVHLSRAAGASGCLAVGEADARLRLNDALPAGRRKLVLATCGSNAPGTPHVVVTNEFEVRPEPVLASSHPDR